MPSLPFRQIHLDFHTSPEIRDVGRDFNARLFAETMKQACVASVTVFAKCHHGHLYYDTRRPERHPHLKQGLNLLGEQVEALHREGIRAPIYISIQCDEYAANHHPEWIARQPDGKPVGPAPFSPGWQILDMSSPYQDYLAEQTEEVLKLFKPVDGIFFDMCWDQPSSGNDAVDGMLRWNLNPEVEADRNHYAHKVALAYMKRFHDMVKASNRKAGVYFNSRPLHNLAEEIPCLTQVEIEALPTGGWGYLYFPTNVRLVRTFGRPYLGMTARFHKSWADFGGLKPYPALEYETSLMMAHGARCSIGDQLHPRGALDSAAYELIGKVFQRMEERKPWLDGAQPLTQAGVFQIPGSGNPGQNGSPQEGAVRMLTQLRQQFDIILPEGKWSHYDLLILPDNISVDKTFAQRLRAYLKEGGALLATGASGLSSDGTRVVLPELGIQAMGMSPYTTTYLRFGREISRDVPAMDHAMYEPGVRVMPNRGGRSLARVVEPYFERSWKHFCSHFQTPPDKTSRYSAAILKGRAAYIAYPIFKAFAQHGNAPCRWLVRNLLDLLLPEPLIRVEGPTGLEATVMKQGKRTIVHLLYYSPERRAPNLDLIEDTVPLFDVPISLKMSQAPKSAYLAPSRRIVKFEYAHGRVNLRLSEIRGHAMVVLESA